MVKSPPFFHKISLAVTWGGSDILLCSSRTEVYCDNTFQKNIQVFCCIIRGRSLCSYGRFGETSWPDLGSLSHYYLTTLKKVAVSINIQRFGVMTLRNYTPMYINSGMSLEELNLYGNSCKSLQIMHFPSVSIY